MASTTGKRAVATSTRKKTSTSITKFEADAQSGLSARVTNYLKSPISGVNPMSPRERIFALIAGALALLLVFLLLSKPVFGGTTMSASDLTAASTGQVALTESELRDTVRELELTVYWAGPVENNLYSLDTRGPGQIYVRYLPNGNGLADTAANYRVVGTYEIKDAFITTKAAGNSVPNSVGFINGDGAAVYYTKESPNNVYLAYEGKDLQVEIFDPIAGVALQLASTPTTVSLIG